MTRGFFGTRSLAVLATPVIIAGVIIAGTVLLSVATSSAFADPDVEKGKGIYNGVGACFSCHGATGIGDGAAAAALTPKPRDFTKGDFAYDTDGDGKKGSETDLFNIVTNGAQKYGGSPMMVGRVDLPEADRKALVKFVMSLKK